MILPILQKMIKTGSDKSLSELKDRLDTAFEIYKVYQEAKLRLYEEDIKSDRVNYQDKLTALDNFIKASQDLIAKQEAFDIATKQREAAREVQHLNESKVGKSGSEKARIDDNIAITEKNLQDAILLIQAQAADDSVKLAENTSTVRQKIVDDELKATQALYDEYAKEEQKNLRCGHGPV